MVLSAFSTITGAPKHRETLPTGRHWAFSSVYPWETRCSHPSSLTSLFCCVCCHLQRRFNASFSAPFSISAYKAFRSIKSRSWKPHIPVARKRNSKTPYSDSTLLINYDTQTLAWRKWGWSPSSMKPFWDLRERHLIKKEKMFLFYIFEDVKVRYIPHPTNSCQKELTPDASLINK